MILIAIGAAITSIIGFIAKSLSMVSSLQRDLQHLQTESSRIEKNLSDNTNLTVQMGKVLAETAPTLTTLTKLTDMYVPKINSLEKQVAILREKISSVEHMQHSATSNARAPVRQPAAQRKQERPLPQQWADDSGDSEQ
jgi:septal ring factor EnvC (AmiA/AmiB activator)